MDFGVEGSFHIAMSEFEIRELSEKDWLEYKAVRLESLNDSPSSFGSTIGFCI